VFVNVAKKQVHSSENSTTTLYIESQNYRYVARYVGDIKNAIGCSFFGTNRINMYNVFFLIFGNEVPGSKNKKK